ncbi:uncharacterized protein LOC130670787 [Microplitis mediator]|uniref:uncharacterized protein LOC130670787 n=1 Tax=Microplitis mediator TaxID=375433 RepID=UPI0025538233|nr:uncharacterized protein LOC130670787 [Microplitis mediator]XP_057330296.1 uncharacterized protein LOC130670787 [Microplitis mediator]
MNLIIVLLSSLLVVQGIPVDKPDNIPHDSNIFVQDNGENLVAHPADRHQSNEPSRVTVSGKPEALAATAAITTNDVNFTSKPAKAFEANDMEESVVHPKDDDGHEEDNRTDNNNFYHNSKGVVAVDDEIFGDLELEKENSGSKMKNNKIKADVKEMENKDSNSAPKIFPDDPKKVTSISDLPLDVQKKFTHEYIVDSSHTTQVPDTRLKVNIDSALNSTTKAPVNLLLSPDEPLTLESRQEIFERSENLIARIKNEEINKKKMPPGIIALVSAVGLATIAVMAYVGLIVWRRYQEYRHGNRELLVNDFDDANDFNNFEL